MHSQDAANAAYAACFLLEKFYSWTLTFRLWRADGLGADGHAVHVLLRKSIAGTTGGLWVPKTCATWPDALLAAGHPGPCPAHASG